MNKKVCRHFLVLCLLLATSSLLTLAGCGDSSNSAAASKDASSDSISKYEQEIAKSKTAAPKKGAR
ncbi:hypothetical protein [Singulisphaera acidiphila]|uniref:Uncharacterized protein n=1 Tax=Singulisphaera acidiphila (strain ATCC BAA-1392 / DSM 18658 / VKM B-2454 / MOB10) TaxID=886293 RepID=L0DBN4_SINAD|nr:hypothetical protein [Singulisphaera acidiphila]AGA26248.1 hypothetical protein Sinac_1886 [Singulisphaera acidiphila DSM 18658]